jgi:hypothetical protein
MIRVITGTLSSLSLEVSAVAQRHFDAYIAGITAIAASNMPPKLYSPPTTRPLSSLSQLTYAAVAS